MEALCPKGEILVTECVKNACKGGKVKFEPAQEFEVKGKGLMTAYVIKQI